MTLDDCQRITNLLMQLEAEIKRVWKEMGGFSTKIARLRFEMIVERNGDGLESGEER